MNAPQPGPYPQQHSPYPAQPPRQYQPYRAQPGQPPQQYQPQYPQRPQYPQYPQYPRPQQPVPGGYQSAQPQPAGYPAPTEGIALTTKYFPLAAILALTKPKVFLDGREVPSAWGRQAIAAQPGRHHLHVHVPWWLPPRIGPADAVADVYPGRLTELEYRAPAFTYMQGSLGVGPQQFNGVGITIALMVVPLGLAFLFVLANLLF